MPMFIAGATITCGLSRRGDLDGNVQHAPPVVLHRQMLEMLLGRRNRNDARLELARLHPLAEFAPRVLV